MKDLLPWLSLLACLLLALQACRGLIADVRGGVYVSMGGDGLFSTLWLLAALAAGGALLLWDMGMVWAFPTAVLVYLLKRPLRALIIARWLGRDLPPPKTEGFKAFVRRSEKSDGSR